MVDLFAGCGGLSLGVVEAARSVGRSVDVRLVAEHDGPTTDAYRTNFDVARSRFVGDVLDAFDGQLTARLTKRERETQALVGKNLDFLVGGPPCQGHSTLNNHTRGDDPKNELYMRMLRAARVLEPSHIVIENVPAIERDSSGVVSRTFRGLESLGYSVESRVIGLADIGVPQLRHRHVLVASSRPTNLAAALEKARTQPRSTAWAIADLRLRKDTPFDQAGALSPENLKRAAFLQAHDLLDLPNHMRPACQQDHHKYKSMYGRLAWDAPAQTITTGFGSPGQGRYFHPSELRTLTPHEAARLQFFPDWFRFDALPGRRAIARAIGNAVPPKLSFILALHLMGRI
jgi:DNA (cytosine-5)-methyltransferase 1